MKQFRIRAFRAVDYPEVCAKYIDGHSRILHSVGVEQVTSSNYEWQFNPAAFVVLCESPDGEKVYGGARVHVAGGSQELPIVDATYDMDKTIVDHVAKYHEVGTGEFCGLWNSLEVAGYGIGAIYLIRASMAIASQLGVKTLFALCSPYTARIASNYGFQKYEGVGDKGTFYYPKLDLLATVVLLRDALDFKDASPEDYKKIMELRNSLSQTVVEENRGRVVEINYELEIDNVDASVFL